MAARPLSRMARSPRFAAICRGSRACAGVARRGGGAALMPERMAGAPGCRAIPPEGGMFVLLDVRGTGLGAADFARRLLDSERVAVLPCDGFGPSAEGHLPSSVSAAGGCG